MERIALVTGAAKRLGAAIVHRLHADGWTVLIHCNQSRAEAETLAARLNTARPDSASVMVADLRSTEALEAMVKETVARHGGLDLLVNNASAFLKTPLAELTETQWAELMDTNLKAPLFLAKHAAPSLAERRGSIVNLTDIYAERPNPDHPAYTAAKAGLAAVTRSLALDLAPLVRVNAVAPGAMLWPEGGDTDEHRARILARIPAGRPGEPSDIAGAVAYLAEAPYVTGHTLVVDGGRSLTI